MEGVRALWLLVLAGCSLRPLDEPERVVMSPEPAVAARAPMSAYAPPVAFDPEVVKACRALAQCVGAIEPYSSFPEWSFCADRVNRATGEETFHWAVSCAYDYCESIGFKDTTRRCRSLGRLPDPDLLDAPGVPLGSCVSCVINAEARLLGRPCTDPSDPACYNADCAASDRACLGP